MGTGAQFNDLEKEKKFKENIEIGLKKKDFEGFE